MGIAILILTLILFAIVAGKLSKFFYRMSEEAQARQNDESLYKEALLTSVQNIEHSTAPEIDQKSDPVESLLRANQDIIEKRNVKKAIESELGVTM